MAFYNPGLYGWNNPFFQPVQQAVQPQYQQNQPQVQNGFIRVPSEDVARNWNVAPGTSVAFINENAPYCYTKTVDISQLDRPRFEKYRLVKEEETPAETPAKQAEYALKADVDELRAELESLKAQKKGIMNDGEPSD